jgi:hypothetical protein
MSDSDSADFRQPTQVTPPEMPGLNSLLTLVTGVVIVSALYLAREVLIPITLAILLSFVLAPLVEVLRRIHVPDVLSVLVAVLIGLGAIGAIGGVIGMQVAGLAADVPRYASTIETKVASVRGFTLGRISELTNRLDHQMTGPVAQRAPSPGASTQGAPDQKPIPVEGKPPASDPLSLARSVLEPILAPFESALIIFIVAVFMFAFVDNFVWRAFVSLNWPSLLDATHNRLDPPNVSCLFTPPSTTHSTSSATSHPVARSASSEKKLSGRGKLLPQPESQLGLPIFARAKFGSRDNAVPMLADFAASAQMEPQCPAFARSGSQPASFSTPT